MLIKVIDTNCNPVLVDKGLIESLEFEVCLEKIMT